MDGETPLTGKKARGLPGPRQDQNTTIWRGSGAEKLGIVGSVSSILGDTTPMSWYFAVQAAPRRSRRIGPVVGAHPRRSDRPPTNHQMPTSTQTHATLPRGPIWSRGRKSGVDLESLLAEVSRRSSTNLTGELTPMSLR